MRVRAILTQADEKMKQFDINMDKGAISNVDVIPPPSFSHWDTQFNYLYALVLYQRHLSTMLTNRIDTAKTQQSNKPSTNPAKSQQ